MTCGAPYSRSSPMGTPFYPIEAKPETTGRHDDQIDPIRKSTEPSTTTAPSGHQRSKRSHSDPSAWLGWAKPRGETGTEGHWVALEPRIPEGIPRTGLIHVMTCAGGREQRR